MKKLVTRVILTMLLIQLPLSLMVGHGYAEMLTPIKPSADANWDKSQKWEYEPENYVGYNADPEIGAEKAVIQFELPPNLQAIRKAVLKYNVTGSGYSDTEIPYVSYYGLTDHTWGPNFPQLPPEPLNNNPINIQVGWNEWDVTSYVASQLADKKVSFALLGRQTGNWSEFRFASDNDPNPANRPQLVIDSGYPNSLKPNATSISFAEDTQSPADIVITPDSSDNTPVTHFKITGIAGGQLFKHDGVTEIRNDEFITLTEGSDGVKFTPFPDLNNEFDSVEFSVQAAQDAGGTGLSTNKTKPYMLVYRVNDKPTANNDTWTSVAENTPSVSIPVSHLLSNDSKGPSNEWNQTLTVNLVENSEVGGTAIISNNNVIFTPTTNFRGPASFGYKVVDNGYTYNSLDPQTSNEATVSFMIDPRADKPIISFPNDTNEDTITPNGIVITPGSGGATTNYFKISGITGGTLYKSNGLTPILENEFITVSEGLAGLKFKPNADANGTTGFSFMVQGAPLADGAKLSDPETATIIVKEVNDAPTALNATLPSIAEDSGPTSIADSSLRAFVSSGVTNESNQTLTITPVEGSATGGTVTTDGDTNQIVFTPYPNFNGTATFRYQVKDNGTTEGSPDPKTAEATASIVVTPVADTPDGTSTITEEDTRTTEGLVIKRNPADGTEVTHYKISAITNGTLYKNDGTTPIHNGDFITVDEGEAGLKFTPAKDANGKTPTNNEFYFNVQAALDGAGSGLSEALILGLDVIPVNDDPDAVDDVLPEVAENSGEHAIPIADLLANDTPGPANESSQQLTIKDVSNPSGGAVRMQDEYVYFEPTLNFNGTASFQYTVEDDGTTGETPYPLTDQATVTIPVLSVANQPAVTGAQTTEDTQSSSGLVITPNLADSDVTHFKITGITGGELFKDNGATLIQNGDFITVTEGLAGLKFTPASNANSKANDTFTFDVQASLDNSGTGLSNAAKATITVTEVNDTPVATGEDLSSVNENSGEQVIPFADLVQNDVAGPANENNQTLTVKSVGNSIGGTVRIQDTDVLFTPDNHFVGTASFEYTIEDNGLTNGMADPKTDTATASMPVLDLSSNANLRNLTISAGDLTFDPNTTDYTLEVGSSVTKVDLTAIVDDSTARLVINGNAVDSGNTAQVALRVGKNTSTIIVTAQDGTTKTYTLTVNRKQPPVIPTPPTSGGGNDQGIVEDQLDLNKDASGDIANSTDGSAVLDVVDNVFEKLKIVTESKEVSTADKLKVLSNTVTDVLGPLMDKMNEGLVSSDDAVDSTRELLTEYVNEIIHEVSASDDDLLQQSTELLADFASTVISKLDKDDLNKLKEEYTESVTTLIDKSNQVEVDTGDTISDLDDKIARVNRLITSITRNLGDAADKFSFSKRIVLTILEEQKNKLRAKSEATITVKLPKEVVNQLVYKQFIVVVRNQQENSMELTDEVLAKLKNKNVELSVEENKSVKIPDSFGDHSGAYHFTILADDKEFTQFGKSNLHVTIAYKEKARDLVAYYYDAKKKSWKQLTDSRGKVVVVSKSKGLASFDTTRVTTFMVAEAPLRSLKVTPKTVKLLPDESSHLNVEATLSNGKKVDVTSEEAGTTYKSSNEKAVKVTEEGVLAVAEDAKSGDKASITVSNGNKKVTVKVTVVTLSSISASASRRTVFAGDKIAVKVKGLLTDRSSIDLTKDKDTVYILEDNGYANVNGDGLLVISKEAPKGTIIKLMVQNSDLTDELEITVK